MLWEKPNRLFGQYSVRRGIEKLRSVWTFHDCRIRCQGTVKWTLLSNSEMDSGRAEHSRNSLDREPVFRVRAKWCLLFRVFPSSAQPLVCKLEDMVWICTVATTRETTEPMKCEHSELRYASRVKYTGFEIFSTK